MKSDRILDVGCGYGRTLNELHKEGFDNLTGVDYSEGMIRRGRLLFPDLDFYKNERSTLPFNDNSFDAVILIAVLTAIYKDREQVSLINEISRVLKNDGILYINDFLINSDDRNLQRYEKYSNKYKSYGIFEIPEGAVLRHHSKEHILEITADFKSLLFKEENYKTMNGNRSKGFCYIGKRIEK